MQNNSAKKRNAIISRLFIFFAIASTGSCSLWAPSIKMKTLKLEVAPAANNDTPIAIDFVVIKNADLLKLLLADTAAQWFEKREQYQRDYPGALRIWGLELVPGQRLEISDIPIHGDRASGLLVFARYDTPGSHRLRLEAQRDVVIQLNSKDLVLAAGA